MSSSKPVTAKPSDKPRRKICVLGSRNVGKSSLVVQFVEGVFVDSYYPTIETTFTKSIKYKGAEYECDILDTAGQDEYSLINSKHAIGIHGYMLVFSLASRASFEMVATVHDKLLAYHGLEALPVVVIGQKSDIVQQRVVEREEAEQMSKELNASYVEVSAAANENVSKAFESMLAEIESRNVPPSGEGGSQGKCVLQ
ncbi:hypothetical protein E3P92_02254 [Wallemia ichthyophaga]|uniref:GTP-binding protein rhb1 n=2 Tax=Wallemia ichthyophaga TaxID=245174 RepID=A0A4T0K3J9_WALIC|nr:GTP-binding protein rhb1 [Wallemia ichthyophaga EXF-994]TIA72433.1 hypothetical protein E3P91_02005 [Wallemia ichthyophaga]EOR01952.1 GTP-binding protein rhb1 [Wallemia ichthyophaga EXF-994]TIA81757.1 hypothetical protein E3P98_01809 [Wallemia ichthyophaga]TIA91220.1 hypothetical protein E3P97_02120 [Wallemia ichthyophaga]TIB00272.1 hypothetical protein E3P95_01745 [Wallemia ichthyophaga]